MSTTHKALYKMTCLFYKFTDLLRVCKPTTGLIIGQYAVEEYRYKKPLEPDGVFTAVEKVKRKVPEADRFTYTNKNLSITFKVILLTNRQTEAETLPIWRREEYSKVGYKYHFVWKACTRHIQHVGLRHVTTRCCRNIVYGVGQKVNCVIFTLMVLITMQENSGFSGILICPRLTACNQIVFTVIISNILLYTSRKQDESISSISSRIVCKMTSH